MRKPLAKKQKRVYNTHKYGIKSDDERNRQKI